MHIGKPLVRQDGFLLMFLASLYGIQYGGNITIYQSPLTLTALLHVDLINVAYISRHALLSGHHDVALSE